MNENLSHKLKQLRNLCTEDGLCSIISMLHSVITMKIKAPSFADLFAETSPQLGGTRRTKFLETLDAIIPWQDLCALISPYYSEGPYPLELMIRVHFLQFVYNLSDPRCGETLRDSLSSR